MRIHTLVFLVATVPALAAAQQFLGAAPDPSVDPNSRFEAAVIKPADANAPITMRMTPGGYDSTVPLGLILRQVLQKPDYQIAGMPGWIDTERFSITAKAPERMSPGATSVLLLNLLKDRFGLVTHVETREQAIFNLVMARPDGRLGPDLKPTPADCQTTIREREEAAKRGSPPPPFPQLPGPNEPMPCGIGNIGFGIVRMSGRTIAQLIPTLADQLARPVIDKTGLTGLYDMSLKFAHDGQPPTITRLLGLVPNFNPLPVDPNAPSLAAALQEQLGLRLESSRGPVEIVVIDRIEKPAFD